MKTVLRISEAACLLGISVKTVRRWDHAGLIECFRTPGGHRRFLLIEIQRIRDGREIPPEHRHTAVYARVSSHEQKQKGDLQRQIEQVTNFCPPDLQQELQIFQDVGSGLNTKRKGLIRLCQSIEKGEIQRVILTYPDRLTRFGFQYLERYFASFNTSILILNQKTHQSLEEELVQDLIAIITSFSGRIHGLRSAKARARRTREKMAAISGK
jgi:excisionase family DNA binding protein